jgi:hypothetical protein
MSNDGDQQVRLAELIAALSLATDLGVGQPMEHVLRSYVNARLRRVVGSRSRRRVRRAAFAPVVRFRRE